MPSLTEERSKSLRAIVAPAFIGDILQLTTIINHNLDVYTFFGKNISIFRRSKKGRRRKYVNSTFGLVCCCLWFWPLNFIFITGIISICRCVWLDAYINLFGYLNYEGNIEGRDDILYLNHIMRQQREQRQLNQRSPRQTRYLRDSCSALN